VEAGEIAPLIVVSLESVDNISLVLAGPEL